MFILLMREGSDPMQNSHMSEATGPRCISAPEGSGKAGGNSQAPGGGRGRLKVQDCNLHAGCFLAAAGISFL